jgi:hypothetical protein
MYQLKAFAITHSADLSGEDPYRCRGRADSTYRATDKDS